MGFDIRPRRRFYAEKMLDEEVVALVFAIGFADGVVSAGDNDEFEGLVGFDEGVGDLHGARWINVVVQFAYDEHQGTFEAVGILDVGAFNI